jgi:hypothetical protein
MSTGCTWIDQLLDVCRKCHEDGEDCAPEDGSPCPFAAILNALPQASEEQIEAATAIFTFPDSWNLYLEWIDQYGLWKDTEYSWRTPDKGGANVE